LVVCPAVAHFGGAALWGPAHKLAFARPPGRPGGGASRRRGSLPACRSVSHRARFAARGGSPPPGAPSRAAPPSATAWLW